MSKSKLVLVVLFVLSLCSAAFAEELRWDYKPFTNNEFISGEYSLKVPDTNASTPRTAAYCSVAISKDGNSIIVNAYDYDWYGKTVAQTVEIDSVSRKVQKHISTTKNGERMFIHSEGGGYDVFWAKCKPHAEALPPEVRAKFSNQWGVK